MKKEKFMIAFNKAKAVTIEAAGNVKEFVCDHEEEIVIGTYVTFILGMAAYSIKAMKLAVKQQELALVKTYMEMDKL